MQQEVRTKSQTANVATHILGGLGNQLFQYAAGRALAKRLGARLFLDCTTRHQSAPPFVLDRYPIKGEIIRDATGKPHAHRLRLPGALGRRLSEAFHRRIPTTYSMRGTRYKVFSEKCWFVFDSAFEKLTGTTYLSGYWQSFRYFEDIVELIRSEIHPIWPLSDANRDWLARIQSENSVCLHVRRGDYLQHKGNAPLVCALSYYDKALEHVRRIVPAPRIFVFSDDVPWCKTAFSASDIAFVDANGPDDAADDLRLMTACRHHIIANSSLSWWGAWLARHPEQVVIAPRPWQPGMTSDSDLVPGDWIKLPRT
jgi:hypothetical protein